MPELERILARLDELEKRPKERAIAIEKISHRSFRGGAYPSPGWDPGAALRALREIAKNYPASRADLCEVLNVESDRAMELRDTSNTSDATQRSAAAAERAEESARKSEWRARVAVIAAVVSMTCALIAASIAILNRIDSNRATKPPAAQASPAAGSAPR